MQPLRIKLPGPSSIGTDGKPASCSRQNQTGTRIAENLMNVGLYTDGGVPGLTTVLRPGHSSDGTERIAAIQVNESGLSSMPVLAGDAAWTVTSVSPAGISTSMLSVSHCSPSALLT